MIAFLLCLIIPLVVSVILFVVLPTCPVWLFALLFVIAILCIAFGGGISQELSGEIYDEFNIFLENMGTCIFTFGMSLMIGAFLLSCRDFVGDRAEDESKAEVVALEEENAELEEEIGAIVKATLGYSDEEYEEYCDSFDNDLIKMADGTLSIQSNVFVLDKIKEYEENLEEIEELSEEEK